MHDRSDEPAPEAVIPTMLTTAEIEAIFKRSNRTIRRWVSRGHLVPVHIGRSLFFRADDVMRLVSGRLCDAILKHACGRTSLRNEPICRHKAQVLTRSNTDGFWNSS